MKLSSNLITAILTIALGVLLAVFKEGIIGIAMTVLGVGLIIWAIIDLIDKKMEPAIIKAVAGVAVILLGWLVASIVLFVFAGLLLIYAIYKIYLLIKAKKKKWDLFVQPVLYAIAAVLFLLNGYGWAFIAAGIVLIVQGALALVACFSK